MKPLLNTKLILLQYNNNDFNMQLSNNQQYAYELFKQGKNIFITGPGGSGKTFLIKKFVEWAKLHKKKLEVCALTGCAAVLLQCNARTIHSWAGIGLANKDNDMIIDNVLKTKYKCKNWLKTDILVIDEVSMMSKKIFDLLNKLGKVIRKNYFKPFGGIQVIFSGDFYQLPPVGTLGDRDTEMFCFESDDWDNTFYKTIQLSKIYRQNDNTYAKILNQIRIGKITKSSYNILKDKLDEQYEQEIGKPTVLLPKKRMVDLINFNEFNKLDKTTVHDYLLKNVDYIDDLGKKELQERNRYSKSAIDYEYQYLSKTIMPEQHIKLAIGTHVMYVVNANFDGENPLVNGTQGVVIGFRGELPIIKFRNNHIKTIAPHVWKSELIPGIGVSQIPLIYSWAITIHKAQGLTLDYAEVNAGNDIFESGQTYVALSRIKTLAGLNLTGFDINKIKINKKVKDFYKSLESSVTPIVIPSTSDDEPDPTPALESESNSTSANAE